MENEEKFFFFLLKDFRRIQSIEVEWPAIPSN